MTTFTTKPTFISGVRSPWWLLLLFFSACREELPFGNNPSSEQAWVAPAHFPAAAYDFEQNPLSEAGIELGRALFYDPILSRDSSVSCASCHHPQAAFADPGKAISSGIDGRLGARNSPALFNLAWQREFMWDGGVNHLDVFPLAPITEPAEMDESMLHVLQKLRRHPRYSRLFYQAFGPGTIDDRRFFHALSQFQLQMVSANSRYDQWLTGKGALTAEELLGYQLVQEHCSGCHSGVLFSDFSYRNNGLDRVFTDAGRGRITLLASDTGSFKVPSLRNVALTAPYMHDGRFATLREVLEHYRHGIQPSATLDPQLANTIPLTQAETAAIEAFLHSLTDTSFTQNTKLTNPFNP